MSTRRIPLRRSLSYQQTKNTVIVAFIIGVILSSVQIYIDYFAEQSEIRKSVNNALATANSAAFHAAFNIDETGALQITRGLVSNLPIIEATITDDFGRVLGKAENADHATTPTLYAWVFGPLESITRELINTAVHDSPVGELSIVVDPSLTAESFVQRAIVVFMSGFVRNVILAISIFVVFYLTFTRSILRASQPIISGKDDRAITMPEDHRDDEIGALIGAFNDHIATIEEQKQQIVASNENLESLVSTRTQQLDERNKELEVERSLAIEASMAKTEFLAMMSHEIRTPMSGILGMAELLAVRNQDSRQQEYVDAIVESSKSLLTLMNSVLDYSKFEQGQMPFERTAFEPARLVYSIIFLLSASAETKHISLESDIDPMLPKLLLGDPEKLRQVLLNLITNAIKFTFDGQVKVSAKVKERSTRKLKIEFSVSDTGIGIESDAMDTIFEPYTQANSSISRRFGGSGMGLAICKQIVEQQGGYIACESPAPGTGTQREQGSRFYFELEFDIAEEDTVDTIIELPEPPASSMTVLVVDDLSINRRLAQGQLENAGHRAVLASSGYEAIDQLNRETINVVLMDLHMPGLDGIQTTHRMHQAGFQDLPVIGITANVSEQKIEECLAAGMDQVIIKPVDQNRLTKALHKALKNTRPEETNSTAVGGNSVIDFSLVEQHRQSLGDVKFVELYLEARDATQSRVKTLTSLSISNTGAIVEQAHAISGLCANFGFRNLASVAEKIEESAEANEVSKIQPLFDQIQAQSSVCISQLVERYPMLIKHD